MDTPQWRMYISFRTVNLSSLDNVTLEKDVRDAFIRCKFESDVSTSTDADSGKSGDPRVRVESDAAKLGLWFGDELIFVPINTSLSDENGKPIKTLENIIDQTHKLKNVEAKTVAVTLKGEGNITPDFIKNNPKSTIHSIGSGDQDSVAYETNERDSASGATISRKIEFRKADSGYAYNLTVAYEYDAKSGLAVASAVKKVTNFDVKAYQDGLWEQARGRIIS